MTASKKIKSLTLSRAKELLDYNPISGELRWRVDRLSGNSKIQAAAGSIAGHRHSSGYIRVKIDNIIYPAQNIIWLLQTGEYPILEIDHENGDGYNNKWDNLRLATGQENMRNRSIHKSNTSGAKGVDFHNGKWRARIIVDYKQIHLGSFHNLQDAAKAREEAEQKYFGRFRRSMEA